MTRRERRRRGRRVKVGSAVVTVAVLAAGVFVVATTPDSDRVVAPFSVRGAMGDTVTSRLLEVEVTDVVVASAVTAEDEFADEFGAEFDLDVPGELEARGRWVVVDAVVTTQQSYTGLDAVELRVDDYRFRVSRALREVSLQGFVLDTGVPASGVMLIEVPEFIFDLPGAAEAELAFNPTAVPRLDSVPVVSVDLTRAPVVDSEVVEPVVTPDREGSG